MTCKPESQKQRLADRVGVDLSEQHHIDKAQTYIDIYEGRTNDPV